jgi:anaerobic selenocysteine-containing dehydrogenase
MEKPRRAVSRRGFLKTALAVSGVALAGGALSGCSSVSSYNAASAQAEEQVCTTYCNACMGCPLEAVVRDDNVVLTRAAEIPGATRDVKRMCARGASIPTMLVETKRVKYPMRRVKGTERGAGQWERISWDEAIADIYDHIKRYQSEYGKGSVCSFTYGTTEPRNLYNLYRLENVAGFSHQNRTTDMALSESLMYTAGGYFYQSGTDTDLVQKSKAFVIWGHNPVVSWPNMWRYIADAVDNGCKLVDVDPNYNTIAQKSDLFVPVRPGTDGALALGMINYMEQNGLTADAYMQQKSCAPFLVKASDGKFLRKSDLDTSITADSGDDDFAVWDNATGALGYAKTASNPELRKSSFEVEGMTVSTSYSLLIDMVGEWTMARTAEVTDVPEDTIKRFIDIITSAGNCDIFQGYGLDHYTHGFNTISAVSALRIVGGMVPDPRSPYSMNTTGFTMQEQAAGHPTTTCQIGTFMFNDLLDTGKYTFPSATMEYGGQTVEIPGATVEQPLKMLINFGANILNSCANRNESIEAYKKFEYVVVTNVEWCDTCDMADVVLPAAMIQETVAPITMDGCLVAGEQCITPRFEAKADYEIAQLIGQGIGLGEYFAEDMETGMAHVMDTQVFNMVGMTYDALKQAKIMYVDCMPLPKYMTTTGRLQFYQEVPGPFEYYGQALNPAEVHLPVWQPPVEAWTVDAGGFQHSALSEKYPLQVIAGTRRFRVHSYYGQNPLLREMEINEPCVRMNPADAEARGIAEGDYVELYNDRGHAVAKALFSDGIRPGMLDIDRGWQASQYKSGCSQELTSKQIVDWSCPNYAYHDCLCEMRKWDGQE